MFNKVTGCVALIVAALLLSPFAVRSASGAKVDFSSGRVSIVADDATLSSIAEQLCKTAGVSVYLDRSEEARKVSVDVQGVSFAKALKNLVHPLNFVIVSDQNGTVTEVRIFRNTGLKESEYRVFAATRPSDATSVPIPGGTASAPRISGPIASGGPIVLSQPSQPPASFSPKTGTTRSLAGPSRLLTGEKAFQANVWVTKQMVEVEQVRQDLQVKAEQIDLRTRQIVALTNLPQTATSGPQQGQTPLPQPAPGVLAAQQGQQSSTLAYQQYATQQSGFNSSIYYQQWMMRENYSSYNMRRGQQ